MAKTVGMGWRTALEAMVGQEFGEVVGREVALPGGGRADYLALYADGGDPGNSYVWALLLAMDDDTPADALAALWAAQMAQQALWRTLAHAGETGAVLTQWLGPSAQGARARVQPVLICERASLETRKACAAMGVELFEFGWWPEEGLATLQHQEPPQALGGPAGEDAGWLAAAQAALTRAAERVARMRGSAVRGASVAPAGAEELVL